MKRISEVVVTRPFPVILGGELFWAEAGDRLGVGRSMICLPHALAKDLIRAGFVSPFPPGTDGPLETAADLEVEAGD